MSTRLGNAPSRAACSMRPIGVERMLFALGLLLGNELFASASKRAMALRCSASGPAGSAGAAPPLPTAARPWAAREACTPETKPSR